jgi:5-methylcytosine-specific restriction endonuclease McrA
MRTLVLNAEMIPTGEVHVTEAVTKLVLGKAYTVEAHPEVVFRSRGLSVPAPLSIAMMRYVRLPASYYGRAPLSNASLFVRDGERCAYCRRSRRELASLGLVLTRDHVLPRSRGGADVWENVVAACQACNCRKGAHTPAEAGMPLHVTPWAPSLGRIHRLRMELRERVLAERGEG